MVAVNERPPHSVTALDLTARSWASAPSVQPAPADPIVVLALCHEHADVEAVFDIDPAPATFVLEPSYEFDPAGRVLFGLERHRALRPVPGPRVREPGRRLSICPGSGPMGTPPFRRRYLRARRSGESQAHRVLSMMPVDDAAELIAGERLYCDEAFVRCLLGPAWEETRAVGEVGPV